MDSVLERVKALEIVHYRFNSLDSLSKKHIGFIAQDVEPLFLETVHYDEEIDRFTMNYDSFGPLVIKALQELVVENKSQETKVETSEEKLSMLEAKLDRLLNSNIE